jgi:hypothetical protein
MTALLRAVLDTDLQCEAHDTNLSSTFREVPPKGAEAADAGVVAQDARAALVGAGYRSVQTLHLVALRTTRECLGRLGKGGNVASKSPDRTTATVRPPALPVPTALLETCRSRRPTGHLTVARTRPRYDLQPTSYGRAMC